MANLGAVFAESPTIPATEAPNAGLVGGIGIAMVATIITGCLIMDIPSFIQIIQRWKQMI